MCLERHLEYIPLIFFALWNKVLDFEACFAQSLVNFLRQIRTNTNLHKKPILHIDSSILTLFRAQIRISTQSKNRSKQREDIVIKKIAR